MTFRLRYLVSLFLFMSLSATAAFAEQPGVLSLQPPAKVLKAQRKHNDYKGMLEKTDFTFRGCGIQNFKVSYSLFTLLGEGAVNGAFQWLATADTPDDCLKYDTVFALKLIGSKKRIAYITLRPTVPKSGQAGWNVAGSPNWDNVFWGLNEKGQAYFYSAVQAKNFWRGGMRITDFIVMDKAIEKSLQ